MQVVRDHRVRTPRDLWELRLWERSSLLRAVHSSQAEQLAEDSKDQLLEIECCRRELAQEKEEIFLENDAQVLKGVQVVGMTVTGVPSVCSTKR